jgi:hypothetical protein
MDALQCQLLTQRGHRKPFIAAISECCAEIGLRAVLPALDEPAPTTLSTISNSIRRRTKNFSQRIKIGSAVRYCLIWF